MPPMVSALGVDIRRLFMIVFGFGTMLAGFAGVMIAPILSVEPGMGDTILILAFVVIVIGGIGSIRGAFLAAMLVGLVDTLGRSFAVDILRLFMAPSPARTVGPAIASMLIYLLMAIVLYRAAGRPVSGAGTLNGRVDRIETKAAPRPSPPTPSCRCCCSASSRWCRSLRGETYLLDRFIRIMIFAIAAIGLDLLVGYGALISFGHAAFMGLGAYAVGILAAHGINEAAIALPVGARGLDAVCVPHRPGEPAHPGRLLHHDHARLRADGILHRELACALWGRRRPDHPGARRRSSDFRCWRIRARSTISRFACLLATYLVCRALVASRFGRVFRGARENPARMASIGFDTYRFQLVAYVVSGALGGLAGFLLANLTDFVSRRPTCRGSAPAIS